MFYYFGSKERLSAKYPSPTRRTIIEPFAGSAGYARLHWEHNVILVEKDDRVVELWERLRRMTPEQALSIPPPVVGERSSDLLVMLRAASEHSLTGEYLTVTERMVSRWPNLLRRIAANIPKVQHWRIIHGDYTDAPDIDATWFIDPPYEMMKRGYRESGLDYPALGSWCRERTGQVIVCEQEGADWLPFVPLAEMTTTNNTRKTEVVWYGDGLVTTGPSTLTWVSRGPEVRATKSGRDAAVWHVTQAGDNAFTAAAHEASATP